jgi:hypothetical protein
MADAQHKLSRRAVLGAALAAPVLSAVEGSGLSFAEGPVLSAAAGPVLSLAEELALSAVPAQTPSVSSEAEGRSSPLQRNWQKALTRYRSAERALAAATHTADQTLYDRLGTRHDRALTHLLNTPAPNLLALADKLDLTLAHQAWELTGTETALFTLPADARRLARTA